MELHVSTTQSFPNTEVIRKVLAEMGGEEIVELGNGTGAATLRWAHRDGAAGHMHIALPVHWMLDADKADRVEEAIRHFAMGMRVAAGQ